MDFKIVDYLFNVWCNPLLKHLSKIWFNKVNQRFNEAMALIIGIFLSNDIINYIFLKIKKYYFIFSKCFIFKRWKRYKYKYYLFI